MNSSMYLDALAPGSTPDEILDNSPYMTNFPAGVTEPIRPNSPKLAPQLQKDSFYYSNDGNDDGQISGFEKLKAFLKGGTYNMVKGMFCDENGFSLKRTLLTAGAATAIALTGPIGAAIAGGVGLVCAGANFYKSASLANQATTDAQARKAYEGLGEGTTTALLSLWGGFKGLKTLKNNFSSKFDGTTLQRLTKWKLPLAKTTPPPEGTGVKPPIEENPIVEEKSPVVEEKTPIVEDTQSIVENNPPIVDEQPVIIEENPLIVENKAPEFVFSEQKALPSPEMVRARMEVDGQIQLPNGNPNQELNLGPIEQYYRTPESQFKIPQEILSREKTYKGMRIRSPKTRKTATKKEIFEGSRSLLERRLGKRTADDYMLSYENAATRTRVKMLPEIFEYIKNFRASARELAKANNNGVLPKGYKDPVQYRDAIDIYKIIQNKNSKQIRSLMKEGKLSIQDIIKTINKSKLQEKYGWKDPEPINMKDINLPTAEQNLTYSSPYAPLGKVPPEVEPPEFFPESTPLG